MNEHKIYTLREKLYSLIDRSEDYNEILKISKELDEAIVEFINDQNNKKLQNKIT